MRSKMGPLGHRRVLNLHTYETEAKTNNPSCIINRFKVLTIRFTVSNDTSSSFSRNTKTDEIKDEVGNAHVYSVPVKDKLAIVRSCSRSFNQSVSDIGNTDPYTADKIQKQVHSLSCLQDLEIQGSVIDDCIFISFG